MKNSDTTQKTLFMSANKIVADWLHITPSPYEILKRTCLYEGSIFKYYKLKNEFLFTPIPETTMVNGLFSGLFYNTLSDNGSHTSKTSK